MKIYAVTTIKNGDEYAEYLGADLNEALKAYDDAKTNYDVYLTSSEKTNAEVEARVYEIADNVDIEDTDELTNAIIDCCGYDEFAKSYNG